MTNACPQGSGVLTKAWKHKLHPITVNIPLIFDSLFIQN